MDELDSGAGPTATDSAAPERDLIPQDGVAETPEAPTAFDGSAPSPVTPRSSRTRWAVGGSVAVLAIAGAVAAAMILGARPIPEALRYLPADSAVVVELRPDLPGDQRQHLGNFLAHFPGFADQSTLNAKLDDTFDRIVSEGSGGSVDYSTRIKPLLAGPMVAAMGLAGISELSGGHGDAQGLLVATTDGSATCDLVFGGSSALESHRGVELGSIRNNLACAVDGRFLLIGDETSIRAGIDAHIDRTGIDTNARFKTARDRLVGDQLGLVFLDGKALGGIVQGLATTAGLDAAIGANVADWMVVGLRVVDDAIQVELQGAPIAEPKLTGPVPTEPPPAKSHFAPMLPADTFGFVEAHGIGANLQRALAILKLDPNQADAVAQFEQALAAVGGIQNVASWIEDLGIAAVPTGDTVGGVILIRGTDAAAVSSRLAQLHNLLILASTGTDISVRDADRGGVTITSVDLGDLGSLLSGLGVDPGINESGTRFAFSMAVRDDVLLLGVGDGVIERVLDTTSGSSLSTTAAYGRVIALVGSPNDVEVYVAIDGLLAWVESRLPAQIDLTTWTREFKPYLEHLAALGEANITTDTGARSRLVITVK